MPVTIRDIAREVNLSHTTVSRVLNRREAINIPEVTRERVLAVARELGYRPNLNARALVTGRTNLVALQLYRLDSPFAMEVARSFQALAWRDGYEVLVHEFDGSDTHLRAVVDGVLLLDRIPATDAASTLPDPTPQVALGAFHTDAFDSVAVDLELASREAMELFLASGRKRVAFLGRRDDIVERLDGRIAAYRSAMAAAQLPEERIDTPENTRAHGRTSLLAHADTHGFPDAIFCENDELAVGCYRALRERGLTVPGDVAVIGCDGIDEVGYLSPELTTIVQPTAELCQVAWTFLKNRMLDRTRERQHAVLPATLQRRESHGK
jgi:LacI family transcriptional regulator